MRSVPVQFSRRPLSDGDAGNEVVFFPDNDDRARLPGAPRDEEQARSNDSNSSRSFPFVVQKGSSSSAFTR